MMAQNGTRRPQSKRARAETATRAEAHDAADDGRLPLPQPTRQRARSHAIQRRRGFSALPNARIVKQPVAQMLETSR